MTTSVASSCSSSTALLSEQEVTFLHALQEPSFVSILANRLCRTDGACSSKEDKHWMIGVYKKLQSSAAARRQVLYPESMSILHMLVQDDSRSCTFFSTLLVS